MHVSLTPYFESYVANKVESGRYNNASEVIREALRLLEAHDARESAKLAILKAEVQKGIDEADRSDFVDIDLEDLLATQR